MSSIYLFKKPTNYNLLIIIIYWFFVFFNSYYIILIIEFFFKLDFYLKSDICLKIESDILAVNLYKLFWLIAIYFS